MTSTSRIASGFATLLMLGAVAAPAHAQGFVVGHGFDNNFGGGGFNGGFAFAGGPGVGFGGGFSNGASGGFGVGTAAPYSNGYGYPYGTMMYAPPSTYNNLGGVASAIDGGVLRRQNSNTAPIRRRRR